MDCADKTVWRKHWLILLQRVGQSFLVWLIVTAMLVATLRTWLPLPWLLPAILWLPATGRYQWECKSGQRPLYCDQ